MTLVILIAVVALAVAVARTTESPNRRDDAQMILDNRLAAGELAVDEHRARRQVLQDTSVPGSGGLSWALVALAGVVLVGVVVGALMMWSSPWSSPMMQMMEGTDMMSGMMGLGWLWMLLVLAFVVGVVVWAVRRLSPSDRGTGDQARRLLDERYARGEIDDDEYARRRDALGR